jgi:hypothetical protein
VPEYYRTLPQNDIKVLAQKGRVDDDQKAQSSLKRLRKHYELDAQEEDNVRINFSVCISKYLDVPLILCFMVYTWYIL